MKVSVECRSPLIQKSLEIFLKKYLSASKHSDIIIRDEKCFEDERCFYISSKKDADLIKPFSKSQLILALEAKYKTLAKKDVFVEDKSEELGIDILEKRIKQLTSEYQENILKTVRAFYEK